MKRKQKQLNLFQQGKFERVFGGGLLVGRRKSKRPLSTKWPIHLVLKAALNSRTRALSYHNKSNAKILFAVANKFHVQILNSVFNYTHAHIVMRVPSREAYVSFIRVLNSKLTELANISSENSRLFTLRPYTRILSSWGRELTILFNYIKKNFVEAIGGFELSRAELDELILYGEG